MEETPGTASTDHGCQAGTLSRSPLHSFQLMDGAGRISSFLLYRNRNGDPTHHIVQLKILFRAQRMTVMAGDAGGRDGAICIDGLEILLLAA